MKLPLYMKLPGVSLSHCLSPRASALSIIAALLLLRAVVDTALGAQQVGDVAVIAEQSEGATAPGELLPLPQSTLQPQKATEPLPEPAAVQARRTRPWR